jgi:hypothetical protein
MEPFQFGRLVEYLLMMTQFLQNLFKKDEIMFCEHAKCQVMLAIFPDNMPQHF